MQWLRWRAGEMHHLEAPEANLSAPAAEVGTAIIERVAEFDEHVQGHEQTEDVLATSIVNQGFNGNERPAGRKSVVRQADEMHFLFEIPVVENHAHRDDVGFR
jgi:hypothetical protein